jgi:hypothetical protein
MQSQWKKKDPKIDLINYVSKQGTVSRIEIVDFMGESKQEVNDTLTELVNTSLLKMDASTNSADFDTFTIPSDIQKKGFNELF